MYNLFSPLIKIYKALYLFAYDMTGNYGVALVLLSLFTFAVLYPFNKKAQQIQNKEHKIQAILSPQIDEIKKQYTGREQYEQLQWLYKRYGYHPLYAIRSALGFVFQIPFLTAAYYMLSDLTEIQGVAWGFIPNLGQPDHLLGGINLLPFIMTLVTVVYAFVMPEISRKERTQTVAIGIFFLVLLYSAPSALLVFWTCNLVWSLLNSLLCKKLVWLGDYITENDLAFHIIFALSLTVGLLVPTDIYVKNASQLWFGYKNIIKYFIVDTGKCFCFLFFVYTMCWRKRIKESFLFLLFGLLLGVFLQSYVIGLDYGTFDGHDIEWNNYIVAGIINTFVWIICLVAVFIVNIFTKCDKQQIKKFIKRGTFVIILVQSLVLLLFLYKNPIQKDIKYEDGKAGVLTTKNLYTVSTKSNIIVFLLDAFDASLFEEILSNNPDIKETLKGFTYYPDTTSSYGYTHYSLPEILTGRQYDNRFRFYDYLRNAWNNNPYYNSLVRNNYLINIYTDGSYVTTDSPINNLVTTKIAINKNVFQQLREIVKFRIVPHFLKYLYYQYYSNSIDAPLIDKSVERYKENDRQFYLNLREGLNTTEKSNCFQFYHLGGIHHPFILNENVDYISNGEKGTAYKQALGSLKIVNEYIQQMKDIKIYKNTVFAIIADHGKHNSIGSRPLFLIKGKGEEKDFAINSRPTEIAELMPFLLKRCGIYSTVIENKSDRFFYYEDKNRKFIKYLVNSPAKDINSWTSLGNIINNADRRYYLGDLIDFSYLGNSFNYKNSGWYSREFVQGSVIAEHNAEIILELKNVSDKKSDLIVKCLIGALLPDLPYQNVDLYANDEPIGVIKFENGLSKNVEYVIPRRLVQNNSIVLRFVVDKPGNGPVYDGSNPLMIMEMRIIEAK